LRALPANEGVGAGLRHGAADAHSRRGHAAIWSRHHFFKEIAMPIILWLLGVPLSLVLLLMLFGVF
jgi:hypothetical protein